MNIKVYTPFDPASISEKEQVVDFLFKHLDQYGDAREDIHKAIQYALKETASHGGFVIAGELEGKTVGTVVINRTGMEGYIPENILVYIAVDGSQRGKGIGKTLMQKAIDLAQGDIALHVEPDNPARLLYEKLGFTNKYLEMRLKNK
jgi:GNAT superfamily N-acetyltransferase